MTKSTVLVMGMIAVAISIVFGVVRGVMALLNSHPVQIPYVLFGMFILLSILMALYVTFDYVRRQIAPAKDDVAEASRKHRDCLRPEVAGTPWESNPDHTRDSNRQRPLREAAGTPWESNPEYTRDSS